MANNSQFTNQIASIIDSLKNLTGLRFYVLVALLFVASLAWLFKDAIVVSIQNYTNQNIEFREVRNLGGLEKEMVEVIRFSESQLDIICSGYAVYIYQPKEHYYQKRLVITNSDVIKTIVRLQSIYLDEQPNINNALKNSEYIFLSRDRASTFTESQHLYDVFSPHILIYSIRDNNKVVGEIHLAFNQELNNEQQSLLASQLRRITFLHIL